MRQVSLVVIVFELTGALSHVLPIMISVMVSKWIGDAISKEGIYAVWIAMRQYPWLPPKEYRDNGQTAAQIMKPVENLVVIEDNLKDCLKDLAIFLNKYHFHGFPIVRGEELVGFVVREKARAYIGEWEYPVLGYYHLTQFHQRRSLHKMSRWRTGGSLSLMNGQCKGAQRFLTCQAFWKKQSCNCGKRCHFNLSSTCSKGWYVIPICHRSIV